MFCLDGLRLTRSESGIRYWPVVQPPNIIAFAEIVLPRTPFLAPSFVVI